MTHNWTYKKLGEVANIHDTLRKPVTKKDRRAGIYPYYGATGIQDYVDNYIFDGRYVLIGEDGAKWGANEQSAYIIEGKSWVNNHAHVLSFTSNVCDSFVAYYLNYKDLDSFISGAIVRKLTQKSLISIPIPIPSLSEQESIVAELDAINHLIDLQEKQLCEYDRLAQSLFYSTFGDPVSNPKGWEVKKLGEVCDVRDGTHDSPQYLQHSDYLLITSKNIVDGRIDFSTATNYISKEDYDAINKRSKVDVGDIIMPMIGTIGHPIIVREAEQRYCIKNVALIKFCGNSDVVNAYVKMLIDSPSYMQYMLGLNKGGTQKFIALGTIRQLSLPLPPLALQQTFAAQIEAIEQQKALIRRSLEHTRTLLAARMQYYFE